MKWIVILGNQWEGKSVIYGPFRNSVEAEEWCEYYTDGEPNTILQLHPKKDYEKE